MSNTERGSEELQGRGSHESGELVIHDEEAGIHIEARVEGVPQGAVARRLRPILRLVEYHRFQSQDGDEDE